MLNTPPNKTMLIVDADETFRECLAAYMRKRGFDVHTCASVQESMAAIGVKNPGYAIIDIRLGDGNGLDVLKYLRQKPSKVRSIILTRYANTRTAVAAIKLGASDYLVKPSSVEETIGALGGPADAYLNATETPVSMMQSRSGHFGQSFDAVV